MLDSNNRVSPQEESQWLRQILIKDNSLHPLVAKTLSHLADPQWENARGRCQVNLRLRCSLAVSVPSHAYCGTQACPPIHEGRSALDCDLALPWKNDTRLKKERNILLPKNRVARHLFLAFASAILFLR
jgi:hypothetical protein